MDSIYKYSEVKLEAGRFMGYSFEDVQHEDFGFFTAKKEDILPVRKLKSELSDFAYEMVQCKSMEEKFLLRQRCKHIHEELKKWQGC